MVRSPSSLMVTKWLLLPRVSRRSGGSDVFRQYSGSASDQRWLALSETGSNLPRAWLSGSIPFLNRKAGRIIALGIADEAVQREIERKRSFQRTRESAAQPSAPAILPLTQSG